MSKQVSKGNTGKKKKVGYRMPAKIPPGEILVDSSKKEWVIQTSIGKGGFGEIYTASSGNNINNQNYVIKIEPSENGPLFCEKTVYIRIGKQEDIKEYLKAKSLKSIGMPTFFGSGTHVAGDKKFRFLVMERYGKDLWTVFLEQKRIFPPATVFKIAIQILDVLEYIHSKGYVHADIKGANLLLGRSKGTENQVFLVDFGLAARYTTQYKPDPRRAHNGTIEYTSRDGHEGIITRRGDIEILGYNLLQWLSSALPWEELRELNDVQMKKNKYLKNVKVLMQDCFQKKYVPRAIEKYFVCLVSMEPLDEPDYETLRLILKDGISVTGDTSSKLHFSPPKSKLKIKPMPEPSPNKVFKGNDGERRTGRSSSSRSQVDETIDIFESSNEEDFIENTPEKKAKLKRSWKDCPSIVSCAELLLKDDKSLRRSKRNK